MSVPGFEDITLPLLKATADGEPHRVRDLMTSLVPVFNLSETDLAELLPSGSETRWGNRVQWAAFYMRRAGILEPVARGVIRITERGRDVLARSPQRIDTAFLKQYPEFQEFIKPGPKVPPPLATPASSTPEEALESSWQVLRDQLSAELLARVQQCPPDFFERLVLDLLVQMGYGGSFAEAAQAVGKTGDGGIDGIIKEDKLGLDAVYVQAKRWTTSVGAPELQAFAGSLQGHHARKGVFITTSTYTNAAQKYVSQIESRIVLIDGKRLVELMIEHGIGVQVARSYDVKRLDADYFEEP